jgi:hypothetical protein
MVIYYRSLCLGSREEGRKEPTRARVNKNRMVNIDQMYKVLIQFECLFKEVIEQSKNEGDINRATYGLSKVNFIRHTLNKYEENRQNKLLKQIDAGFVSITRGVEYFDDYETNKKFFELFNGIPDIKSYIK